MTTASVTPAAGGAPAVAVGGLDPEGRSEPVTSIAAAAMTTAAIAPTSTNRIRRFRRAARTGPMARCRGGGCARRAGTRLLPGVRGRFVLRRAQPVRHGPQAWVRTGESTGQPDTALAATVAPAAESIDQPVRTQA